MAKKKQISLSAAVKIAAGMSVLGLTSFFLISILTSIQGIQVLNYTGDIECANYCESTVTFNSTKYDIQFSHLGDKTAFLKSKKGVAVFNVDKLNELVQTNPPVLTDVNMIIDDKEWRLEGFIPKGTPFTLKIMGYKKPEQTIKWSVTGGVVNIDPVWSASNGTNTTKIGDSYEVSNNQSKNMNYTETFDRIIAYYEQPTKKVYYNITWCNSVFNGTQNVSANCTIIQLFNETPDLSQALVPISLDLPPKKITINGTVLDLTTVGCYICRNFSVCIDRDKGYSSGRAPEFQCVIRKGETGCIKNFSTQKTVCYG